MQKVGDHQMIDKMHVIVTPFDTDEHRKAHPGFDAGVIIFGPDPVEIETEIRKLLAEAEGDSWFSEVTDIPFPWRAVGKLKYKTS